MIFLRTVFFVLLVLVTGVSFSQGALNKTCWRALSSHSNSEDLQLEEILELRRLLISRLGLYKDPFIFAKDLNHHLFILSSMVKAFPLLEAVIEEFDLSMAEHRAVDEELENKIIQKAKELEKNKTADLDAVSAASQALLKLAVVRLRDVESIPKPSPNPTPKSGQKQKEKNKEPPSLDLSSMPKYRAHNKNAESDETSGEQVSVAWVNKSDVVLFKEEIYQIIDARTNDWTQAPLPEVLRRRTSPSSIYTLDMQVGPQEKDGVLSLLLPQGFVPETFQDEHTRVFQDETGNYRFTTDLEHIKIPLFEEGSSVRPLSPLEIQIYTASTGVELVEWPEHIQHAANLLLEAKNQGMFSGPKGNVEIAEALAGYISKNIKYALDEDENPSPLHLVKKGEIQCDTSVTLAISILRGVFKIPCRAVGGHVGVVDPKNPDFSHVVIPLDAHAWLEVSDEQGNWWTIDPTPKEDVRERKKPQSEGKSKFRRIKNEQKNSKDSQDSQGPQDSQGSTEKTLEEIISEKKKAQAQAQTQAEKDQKSQKEAKEGAQNQATPAEKSSFTPQSRFGATDSLLKELDAMNPFVVRLLKRMSFHSLDPSIAMAEKNERLSHFKGVLGLDKEAHFPAFKRFLSLLEEAQLLFVGNDSSFEEQIENLIHNHSSINLNDFSDALLQVQRQIFYTLKFADFEESKPLQQLHSAIQDVRFELGKIKHENSKAIRIAKEVFDHLPGEISKSVLRREFGINAIGANDATMRLAKAIQDGRLNDYRMLAVLGPHTHFVTDPIHFPSTDELKTWMPAIRRQRGAKDILLTSDPRAKNTFKLYEYLSDKEAFKRGLMGRLVQRRKVKVPHGFVDVDPEDETIVIIDTSGSMSGSKQYFLSMWVGALVDRALSDANGKHKFTILLGNTKIYEAIDIKNREQAVHLISSLNSRTQNSGGGTDIKEWLLDAAKRIKEANKKGKKALSKAAIIVCSDGEDPKSTTPEALSEIRTALSSVGNKTGVLVAFNAIGGQNSTLFSLSQSKKLGSDKTTYLAWEQELIEKIIRESRVAPEPVNDFWTEYSWNNASSSVRSSLRAALHRLEKSKLQFHSDLINLNSRKLFTPVTETFLLRTNPEFWKVKKPKGRSSSIGAKLKGFRRVLHFVGQHFEDSDRRLFLEEVLREWNHIVEENFDTLSLEEMAHLHYILGWPKTGRAGNEQ